MLKTRLISAVIIAAILATTFFWKGLTGALVFVAIMTVAVYEIFREYSAIVGNLGFHVPRNSLRVFGFLLLASVVVPVLLFAENEGASVLTVGEILVLTLFLMYSCREVSKSLNYVNGFSNLAVTITGMAILYGSLNFIPKLYFLEGIDSSGRYLLLFVLAVTKAGDIGAYVAGTATGRLREGNHKLSPRLSPKKSWEGLAGGIASSALGALIVTAFFGGNIKAGGEIILGTGTAMLLGVAFAVLGLFGDLAVSFLKRAADIDDSGRLPGLGGVLDVADSLIFTVPVFYVYVQFQLM